MQLLLDNRQTESAYLNRLYFLVFYEKNSKLLVREPPLHPQHPKKGDCQAII